MVRRHIVGSITDMEYSHPFHMDTNTYDTNGQYAVLNKATSIMLLIPEFTDKPPSLCNS